MKDQLAKFAPIIGSILALSIVSVQVVFKNQERLKWFLTGLGILVILIVFVLLIS